MSKDVTPGGTGELLIYPADDANGGIRVLLAGETVWLTQRQIAELYQVSVPTVNEHLANAFEESEIEPERTIRKFRIVQPEDEKDKAATCKDYLQARQEGHRAAFQQTGLAGLVE